MPYLVGVVISFFLAFILAGKKNKIPADRLLAIWLFVSGFHLLFFYLLITDQYAQFHYLMGGELPLPLVHGPLLYLYVSSLTQIHPLKKSSFAHFLPFFIALCSLVPFFLSSSEDKILVYQNEGAGYETLLLILGAATILSGIGYSLLSLRVLFLHQKSIGERYSNIERINLSWLRYLILGSSLIWLIAIFGSDESLFTALVLYMVFIGYFGIKQAEVFSNRPSPTASISEIESASVSSVAEVQFEKVKYEKSGLSSPDLQSIHGDLVDLMQRERLFTNAELTLTDTAQQLGVHPNVLSQVINSVEERNFFDYINGQRVEEFKRLALVPENQKFTLLSLAFECGFNSKTSFNRNFKKSTGLSPSEYLNQSDIHLL